MFLTSEIFPFICDESCPRGPAPGSYWKERAGLGKEASLLLDSRAFPDSETGVSGRCPHSGTGSICLRGMLIGHQGG